MDVHEEPSEPYSPRRDDHLVEPMFGGLGVGDEPEESQVEESQVTEELSVEEREGGLFVRFVRVVRRVTRRRPRESGSGR